MISEIAKRFLNFIALIVDPWIISLISITFFFGTLSNEDNLNNSGIFFSLLFAISSGILGGILSKRWDDFNKNTKIRAKGISSIRSLKLIRKHVLSLQNRVDYYKNNNIRTKIHFDEIIERCKMLDFSIKSSIENWVDILPDQANILEKVNNIDVLKIQFNELQNDFKDQFNTLETNEKQSREKDIKQLERYIHKLERSVNSTGAIYSSGPSINVGVTPGILSADSPISFGQVGLTTDSPFSHGQSMLSTNSPISLGDNCIFCNGSGKQGGLVIGPLTQCSHCHGTGKQ